MGSSFQNILSEILGLFGYAVKHEGLSRFARMSILDYCFWYAGFLLKRPCCIFYVDFLNLIIFEINLNSQMAIIDAVHWTVSPQIIIGS